MIPNHLPLQLKWVKRVLTLKRKKLVLLETIRGFFLAHFFISGSYLYAYKHTWVQAWEIQWNFSITDTLGTT